MVKLTIGGGGSDEQIQWPAARNVRWFLQPCEILPADEKFRTDRLKWPFEAVSGVPDEFIGKVFNIYTNMPTGDTVSPRSNLYKVLEGVSAEEFEPGDEIDTGVYEGREYTGNLKREQRQKNIGTQEVPKFAPSFDDDGKPIKKTVLVDLYPAPEETPARGASRQSGYNWNRQDDDDE